MLNLCREGCAERVDWVHASTSAAVSGVATQELLACPGLLRVSCLPAVFACGGSKGQVEQSADVALLLANATVLCVVMACMSAKCGHPACCHCTATFAAVGALWVPACFGRPLLAALWHTPGSRW